MAEHLEQISAAAGTGKGTVAGLAGEDAEFAHWQRFERFGPGEQSGKVTLRPRSVTRP
jgi:hypothetical protein